MTIVNNMFPCFQIEVSDDYETVKATTVLPYEKTLLPGVNRPQRVFRDAYDYDKVLDVMKNTRMPLSWVNGGWNDGYELDYVFGIFSDVDFEHGKEGKIVTLTGHSVVYRVSERYMLKYERKFRGHIQGINFPHMADYALSKFNYISTIWE